MTNKQIDNTGGAALAGISNRRDDYLGVIVGEQMFGIQLGQVRDILDARDITRVLQAPPCIHGLINLRGRIVTVIDLRKRLDLTEGEPGKMHVVVEQGGEPYSLLVDEVTEAYALDPAEREGVPAILEDGWREVSTGVHRVARGGDDTALMLVVDTEKLLDLERLKAR